MSAFYKKKWFIVPHEEYPADSTLHLGQLVGSIDTVSDSLNRTTRIAPYSINETLQTNFNTTVTSNRTIHGGFDLSSPFSPASLGLGGGIKQDDEVKLEIDVVQTQIFSPTDDYAKSNFQASQQEPEMVNYMRKSPWEWKKNVFMIAGRKVGKAMTVNRDQGDGFDQKAKLGFDIQGAATIQADLDLDWKRSLNIKSFSEQPCVFAVHLRKVVYHADPEKPVTSKIVVGGVMGKDDEGEVEEVKDMELLFDEMTDEGPRVDKWDYRTVVQNASHGEEDEFLVKI
ncbi:hypothetical protein N431DRAFT_439935 [Stipitochalara longipes BDJ]|nr:hypothetical protein N431DRAFT_439935 [Stipitochalara longipes BDJ]